MEKTRTEYVKKNIIFGYLSTIAVSIFSIICRTVFVYKLGANYLGVSGLFTNVLGVLSFTELGIGTAINFSLYKPIAENDTNQIKALLRLYKKAYRLIALVVTIIGISLIPFLQYIVNTDIPISEIKIYYIVFLFNTVSSYFVTYKTSYVSALQKEYIVTNTSTLGSIIINIFQILLLLLGGNYLEYLLIAAFLGLLQKIGTVYYLNKKFHILIEKDGGSLDPLARRNIWTNVKALIIHKIGDVSVNQTDNIIISTFVNTTAVGLLSNYTTLNTLITTFTNKFFSSFTASFGNMIAKDNIEKQKKIFEIYDLLGFWIYGFVLIAFITLSQPFITLWLGEKLLIDNLTMCLYFFSMYLAGISFIPYNYKIAAGKFEEDKWIAFIQAIVNLIISIISVKIIGLAGIFIGTILSRIIVVIIRPYIVYKYILKDKVINYFIRLTKRTILASVLCVVLWKIKSFLLLKVTVIRFILMGIIVVMVPNIVFFLCFRNQEAFKDILNRIRRT